MPPKGTPAQKKAQVFKEFKAGTLNSGKGGPIVRNPKQAVAIALSVEERAARAAAKRRGR